MNTKSMTQKEDYIKKVYKSIIYLALAMHVSFVIIFLFLKIPFIIYYNIGSVLFYAATILLVNRGCYRLSVSLIHGEVCLFAFTSSLIVGWNMGFPLYLIALSSMVYFCPYQHKYVPYFISFCEIVVFFVLKITLYYHSPYNTEFSPQTELLIFCYNACCSFAIILYAAIMTNVSAAVSKKELEDANESLAILANYDTLTNLITRRYLMQIVEEADTTDRILAMCDIDNFKRINDTYGHICGDYVLRTIADLMKTSIGAQADICRWGGEEFVLLFFHSNFSLVKKQIQDLCETIASYPFCFEETVFSVTATFGLSNGENCASFQELLQNADELMYLGKISGKNKVIDRFF